MSSKIVILTAGNKKFLLKVIGRPPAASVPPDATAFNSNAQSAFCESERSAAHNFLSDSSPSFSYSQSECIVDTALQQQLEVHSSSDYHCNVSGASSNSSILTQKYGSLPCSSENFPCIQCRLIFQSRKLYSEHMKEIHNSYVCNICGDIFSNESQMDEHSRRLHKIKVKSVYICAFCGHNCATSEKLQQHELIHSNVDGFRCLQCSRIFILKAHLLEHMLAHQSDPNGALEIKRPSEHPDNDRFACGFCQKSCNSKGSLEQHLRTHTGEKPFECPTCGKRFSHFGNYRIHKKLHETGTRSFCRWCGRWFYNDTAMREHEKDCLQLADGFVPPGKQPTKLKLLRYGCEFCEKRFHYLRDKRIHERVHNGLRPYTCGYCERSFTQSQALTIHIRLHTGERPYKCQSCGKAFRENSVLRKHQLLVHGNLISPNSEKSQKRKSKKSDEFLRSPVGPGFEDGSVCLPPLPSPASRLSQVSSPLFFEWSDSFGSV